jgi:DNA-binding transcriptional ArsR family regulator
MSAQSYGNAEEDPMVTLDHAHPVDPERVAHARGRVLSADDAARLSGLLGLLADPVRSRILSALDHVEELCVGDLALALDISEDAASYGLRLLRTAGMVANRKVGRIVYYRLADEFPEPLLAHCLHQLITLTRAVESDDGPEGAEPTTAAPTEAASEEVQR